MNCDHDKYMSRAIQLAKLGKGNVAPNPMVGSVIVHQDKIIGEGYHQKYGEGHAEVNAIRSVTDADLLKESTIYVTLEPCAHFGKTPPCARLIVEKQIPKVIIGCRDSYEEVDGKGIQILKDAGIEVEIGIMKTECQELNKRFFCFHQNKRPYVILKWAESADGFMDIERSGEKGIFWLSQAETKQLVHKWRHEEAGILIGAKTLMNDNPSLTVREYNGKSPTRFILDERGTIQLSDYKMNDQDGETYIINQNEISDVLNELYQLRIQSVIIEGGRKTLQRFIDSDLWDEARIIKGVNYITKGTKSPDITGKVEQSFTFGKDHIEIIRND